MKKTIVICFAILVLINIYGWLVRDGSYKQGHKQGYWQAVKEGKEAVGPDGHSLCCNGPNAVALATTTDMYDHIYNMGFKDGKTELKATK